MNKNKHLTFILAAVMTLCFVPCAQASANQAYVSNKVMRALEQKILEAGRSSALGQTGLKTVKTHWKVIPTKVFRKRKVSVNIAWGKAETVQTSCAAIEKNGKIYVIKSCYYPVEKQNQEAQWLGSELLTEEGNIRLENPKSVREDWVVFELPKQNS